MEIETLNYILKPLDFTDIDALNQMYLWGTDKDSSTYLNWGQEKNLEMFIARKKLESQWIIVDNYIIYSKSNLLNPIGFIKIKYQSTILYGEELIPSVAFIYHIAPEERNKGIMTECIKTLIDVLPYNCYSLSIAEENIASQKIAAKCGFKEIGYIAPYKKYIYFKTK